MSKPGNFIIAGGVFILIIFAGTWLISSGVTDSSSWVDETRLQTFNDTFNNFAKYNTEVTALHGKVTATSGASSDSLIGQAFDFINNLVNSGWTTLKLLWGSFDFIYDSFGGLTGMFGIPDWLVSIIILLLLAVFIFGLLSAIFGKEVIGK